MKKEKTPRPRNNHDITLDDVMIVIGISAFIVLLALDALGMA